MSSLFVHNFKKALGGSFALTILAFGLLLALTNWQIFGISSEVEAATDDNVAGFAWSENIGWISMNNTSDGSTVSYGVNINADNSVSGWAWSDNVGWICFGATCDTGTYGNTPEGDAAQARINAANGEVSGWAKIIAYDDPADDSGWIALRANFADQNQITYGVKICLQTTCDYTDADNNSATAEQGEWYYWAWSDAIGWIDFGPRVNGSHVGATTGWRPTNPFSQANFSALQPQGIFEPLCCVDDTPDNACEECLAGTGACDPQSIRNSRAYCDGPNQGQPLPGVHLHTLNMAITNLNLPVGTEVSCKVKSPGLCENVPTVEPLPPFPPQNPCFTDNQCGYYCVGGNRNDKSCQTDADCPGGACSYWEGPCELDTNDDPSTLEPSAFTGVAQSDGTITLNYLLRGAENYTPLPNANIDKRMPWVIESCSVAGGESVELCYNWKGTEINCLNNCANPDCANYTVFVHPNTWTDSDTINDDVYRARQCRGGYYDYYFGNKVKCTTEGDVVFSTNQYLGDEPEILCNDGIDNDNNGQIDCGDRNCKSIAYNCLEHKKLCLSDEDCSIGTACDNGLCEIIP